MFNIVLEYKHTEDYLWVDQVKHVTNALFVSSCYVVSWFKDEKRVWE